MKPDNQIVFDQCTNADEVNPGSLALTRGFPHQRQFPQWELSPQFLTQFEPEFWHKMAVDQRTASTGNWIFAEPDFEDWLSGRIRILWLYALCKIQCLLSGQNMANKNSRCRKNYSQVPFATMYAGFHFSLTFLASSNIIDRLDKHVQENDSQSFVVAYHYCDFKDSRTWDVVDIIASILKQLLSRNSSISDDELQKILHDLYNGRERKRRIVTVSQIHELFCSITSVFSRVYIVLDGLDEIPVKQREDEVIPYLRTLIDCVDSFPIFLIVSSRPEPDIRHLFENKPSLRLGSEKISKDIEVFVRSAIGKYSRLRTLKESFQEELVHAIVRQAKGMYV